VYKLGNTSYWIDENFTLMQVQGIIERGFPLLDSGFIEKKDTLFPDLLVLIAFFWGISSEFTMRIIVVLFGTANIF